MYKELGPQGLVAVYVITENDWNGHPDAAYCKRKRSEFGLTMTVVYDKDGEFVDQMNIEPNGSDLVIGPKVKLEWRANWGSEWDMKNKIKELLDAP
jgi:peroxiredoxin